MILIRVGEIWTKGRNRDLFIKKLIENLKPFGKKIRYVRPRIFMEGEIEKILKVPGIESLSEGVIIEREIDKIKETARKMLGNSETFAVRTKRIDKNFEINSQKMNEIVGEYLSKFSKVDLKNPQTEIIIEIFNNFVFVGNKTIRGIGGLPVGIEGRVVSLVSTGIDSPVSTWMMMRRGCLPTIIHLDMGTKDDFIKIIEKLREYHPKIKAYVIPYYEVISKYKIETRSWCLICKRLMLRIAERIAKKEDALAIVTGESIGQVASQTLTNLKIIERATNVLILRPLIGMNKSEIINYAKKIGTYDLSTDFKCPMVPKKPTTRGKLKQIEKLESKLPIERIIRECINSSYRV